MRFGLALAVASRRHGRLTADERQALRKAILRNRSVVSPDGVERNVLDVVEEGAIVQLQVTAPALLASAVVGRSVGTDAASSLVGAIDWGKLLDWLVANLPKILEIIMSLIALF